MVAPLLTFGSLLISLLHNNHGLDLSRSCKSASWESSCNLEFGWIGCCSPTEIRRFQWVSLSKGQNGPFNWVPRVRWRPGEFDDFCLSGCIYTLKLLVPNIYIHPPWNKQFAPEIWSIQEISGFLLKDPAYRWKFTVHLSGGGSKYARQLEG